MKREHTPTPWYFSAANAVVMGSDNGDIPSGFDYPVADCGDRAMTLAAGEMEKCVANAEFIVRACNVHDDLVALARLIDSLDSSPMQRDYVAPQVQDAARAVLRRLA